LPGSTLDEPINRRGQTAAPAGSWLGRGRHRQRIAARTKRRNRFGRCEGTRYPQTPCDQLCGPYRPPGLPPQYGGQGPGAGV